MKKESPYQLEYDAFSRFIEGKSIPIFSLIVLVLKSFLSLFEMCIRYLPGGFGYKLRYYYYKLMLKNLGKDVLIDTDVSLNGTKNISIGDYSWIDSGCRIDAVLGEISIGKRVHIAPYSILASREPIIVGDYVGISSGVKIYSNSEHPINGKRMSGPMVPERFKAFHSKKIVLEKDSFVGTGSVLLPGASLGEGAVVGANSVITKKVAPYTIVVGASGRVIGKRDTVTAPEL